jgi:AcrR family transcriptional regulator
MPYPARINRDKILKHGLRLLEKEGIESLSLRAIARKLKVAVNALYNYYPNRRALEFAIAAEGYKILQSNLVRAGATASSAASLPAFCKEYLRFAHAHRRLFELMTRKRPPKSELRAIAAQLTSLIMKMRGRKLREDRAAKEAFTILALLQGIIAVEQQIYSRIPASYASFAMATAISEITQTRRKKKAPRQAAVRSRKSRP